MTKALEPNDQKPNMDEALPEADGGFDFKDYLLSADESGEESHVNHDHHEGRPTDQPSEPEVKSVNIVSPATSSEPKTRAERRRIEVDRHDAVRSIEEEESIPAERALPKSREEKRAAEQSEDRENKKIKRRLKVRLVPVWLRLVIILVLSFSAIIVGAMIGYGVLGKGNPMDVFDSHTWTHIVDIVTKPK